MKRRKHDKHEEHHGGSWKIAYADFITTMMAFFLLLWILAVLTEDQKKGISDYFAGIVNVIEQQKFDEPTKKPVKSPDDSQAPAAPEDSARNSEMEKKQIRGDGGNTFTGKTRSTSNKQSEAELFKAAEEQLLKMAQESAELRELASHLAVDQTEDGLRIQIIDQQNRPLFVNGSAEMLDHTIRLIEMVGQVIKKIPNSITITGHTDASPLGRGPKYTNWELSVDRANSGRRVLAGIGFPEARISSVIGKESTDPLVQGDPFSPSNRRVTITILKQH